MSYCTKCGKPLPKDAMYCASCGNKVVSLDEPGISEQIKNIIPARKKISVQTKGTFIILAIFVVIILFFWKKGPSGTYYDERDGDTYVFKDGYISYGSIYAGWTEGGEPYKYSFGNIYGIGMDGEEYTIGTYLPFKDQVEMEDIILKKFK